MTYKELKNKIKEEQKIIAQQIRIGKPLRKPSLYNQASEDDKYISKDLEWNRDNYRHTHIVYCEMFNNTPYELIEQPRDDNKPSTYQLKKIRAEWEGMLDEQIIRDCA